METLFRIGIPLLFCCHASASEVFTLDAPALSQVKKISADGTTVLLSDRLWTPRTGAATMLPPEMSGEDISADGSTVVGDIMEEAVRWTSDGNRTSIGTGDIRALSVSPDGSVVAGLYRAPELSNPDPYRWTEASGIVSIDTTIPTFIYGVSVPTLVSDDGSVITGRGTGDFLWGAYRWTEGTGMVDLGALPGKPNNTPWAMSADGTTVVGIGQGVLSNPESLHEAWRWTEETGMVGLGALPGREQSFAETVSADGKIVLGTSRTEESDREMFAWSESTGMVSLTDILVAEVGAQPWLQSGAIVEDISADQRTIAGWTRTPEFEVQHVWAVELDQPLSSLITQVPEPTGSCLAILGILAGFVFRNRRR